MYYLTAIAGPAMQAVLQARWAWYIAAGWPEWIPFALAGLRGMANDPVPSDCCRSKWVIGFAIWLWSILSDYLIGSLNLTIILTDLCLLRAQNLWK